MEIQGLDTAQQALEKSRLGDVHTLEALISFCVLHPEGVDQCTSLIGSSRKELQELIWQTSQTDIRIADPRLVKKTRSGSSFDAGSYNYGSPHSLCNQDSKHQ